MTLKLWEALRELESGKEVEFRERNEPWRKMNESTVFQTLSYARVYEFRLKPKPLECWVNVLADGYITGAYNNKEIAKSSNNPNCTRVAVHMREVVE